MLMKQREREQCYRMGDEQEAEVEHEAGERRGVVCMCVCRGRGGEEEKNSEQSLAESESE